jgi:hypothetical protein
VSTTAYWIGGVARSNSEDNDKSKYDGRHEDDIDNAHAFSFVDHLILARTELNSISPVSNRLEMAAKLATVRGMLWRFAAWRPVSGERVGRRN